MRPLPAPSPDNLARQVRLLQAMGGPSPVPGYSSEEMSRIRDRVAAVLVRTSERATWRPFERPRP